MPNNKSHYLKILGLDSDANQSDIKKAFRKKARQYHPDMTGIKRSEKKFIEICDAYQKLLDDDFNDAPSELVPPVYKDLIKKYNKNLTPEELEIRLKRARDYAKIKAFREKHIRRIALHQIKNSTIKKLNIWVCVIAGICWSLITLDYLILEPKPIEGVILTRSNSGFYITYGIYDIEASRAYKEAHPFAKSADQYITIINKMGDNFYKLPKNIRVNVLESRIFKDYLRIEAVDQPTYPSLDNYYSFHFLFWGYFIIFLAPIAVNLFRGPTSFYILFLYLTTHVAWVTIFFFILNIVVHAYGSV